MRTLVVLWSVCATLLIAIGCRPARSDAVDSTPETGGTLGFGGEGGELVVLPPPPNCETGDVHECKVYYEVGGIQNCFVGVQVCVEGEWEICTTQEKVDERLAELASAGHGGASNNSTSAGAAP